MDNDIALELLEKIKKKFKERLLKNKGVKKLLKDKKTYDDVNKFSDIVGATLSNVLNEEITKDDLPNGKMYYNIAKKILESTLKENFYLVSDFSTDVQEILNKDAGLNIKAFYPEINKDKIEGLARKIAVTEDFKWLLNEPIKSFTKAVVDDTIKVNAEKHYKLGLRAKIERKINGKCCDWCKEVAGVYEYPNVPKDVYRRHERCTCTLEYFPKKGKKQNVWTKKWTDDDKIRQRIKFSEKEQGSNRNHFVNDAIKKGFVKDDINVEKQERHLKDSHIEGRSFLNGDLDFAKDLYSEFKGKGTPIIVDGKWQNKERVNTGRNVATYDDGGGNKSSSNNIIIVYSKTGSHILGGRPDES